MSEVFRIALKLKPSRSWSSPVSAYLQAKPNWRQSFLLRLSDPLIPQTHPSWHLSSPSCCLSFLGLSDCSCYQRRARWVCCQRVWRGEGEKWDRQQPFISTPTATPWQCCGRERAFLCEARHDEKDADSPPPHQRGRRKRRGRRRGDFPTTSMPFLSDSSTKSSLHHHHWILGNHLKKIIDKINVVAVIMKTEMSVYHTDQKHYFSYYFLVFYLTSTHWLLHRLTLYRISWYTRLLAPLAQCAAQSTGRKFYIKAALRQRK